ncbi:MAG: hypothetical protein ACREQ5_13355, partial [Candidatus Dormibacteria bacterium]
MATTQTTSPAGLHATSDYTVTTLAIVTSDGTTIDLSSLYLEINLYEDLFSPCMSGSILMGEALDLISNFKLHGNEYLVMNIDKPGLGKPINKVFRIYKIGDRELTGSALQNYTIYFASEELILSTQHYVSKSYHGMQISDMVNDLLTNQLGVPKTKTNFMDKTDGIFNIIVPRMQPLEAIQWLATRSYSANGSLYMFYESRDGYNFVSIESLMKLPTYQTYYL